MLLQNRTLHAQYPYTMRGASTTATASGNLRSQLGARGSSQLARFCNSDWYKWQSFPSGYGVDSSIFPPLTAGGLGAANGAIVGVGSATGTLQGAKEMAATITGSGSLTTANLSLLVPLAATILSQGIISSAPMQATISLAATLAGSGDVTAGLGLLANCVATLTGSGSVSDANLYGTASLSATIYVNEGTASVAQMAEGVWNALAADYNDSGTMGQKLNGAASAGDPWSTELPGAYAPDQAGGIVGSKLLTVGKFLGLK